MLHAKHPHAVCLIPPCTGIVLQIDQETQDSVVVVIHQPLDDWPSALVSRFASIEKDVLRHNPIDTRIECGSPRGEVTTEAFTQIHDAWGLGVRCQESVEHGTR